MNDAANGIKDGRVFFLLSLTPFLFVALHNYDGFTFSQAARDGRTTGNELRAKPASSIPLFGGRAFKRRKPQSKDSASIYSRCKMLTHGSRSRVGVNALGLGAGGQHLLAHELVPVAG